MRVNMHKKQLRAFKKWHTKEAFFVAATREQAKNFFPEWGIISAENASGYNLHVRYGIPLECVILSHTIWARGVMRPEWERVKIETVAPTWGHLAEMQSFFESKKRMGIDRAMELALKKWPHIDADDVRSSAEGVIPEFPDSE